MTRFEGELEDNARKKIGYVFLLFSSLALNKHWPQIIAVLTIQRIE